MEIKIETGGLRLDKALSDLSELSRSLANEQIKSGQVLVNGQVKKANTQSKRVMSSLTMCQNQRY
ncbi:ribosomal large subunit pseudouridine synthase D [Streptococcus pneumoniae SP23-BS72]|nr:ribosomal large subunit pseudouridine synthase D [Streptococcus pneumoniae SP23-BS72]